MKREIKFRAWVNDIQHDYDWHSKQWSSSDRWRMAEVLTIHINKNGARCRYVSEYNKPEVSDYEIGERCTIMQFTGLLDKNGKEIYEGDIVEAKNWNPMRYAIEFIEGGFCFTHPKLKGSPIDINLMFSSQGCACAVIGNIHENPELLK